MRATLTREFRFEAAHLLPNHAGKCARPHGHSYRVLVELEGAVKGATGESDEGMVYDFDRLKELWEPIHERVDHRDLNEVLGPEIGPTTAENIAGWLLAELRASAGAITAVTVWETSKNSATVRA